MFMRSGMHFVLCRCYGASGIELNAKMDTSKSVYRRNVLSWQLDKMLLQRRQETEVYTSPSHGILQPRGWNMNIASTLFKRH
jgi:hypothetical protein